MAKFHGVSQNNPDAVVYTTLLDDFTITNKTFMGYALPGSGEDEEKWRIKCIDETGDYTKIQFADGVSTFTKIWDNRTNYSYS